MKISKVLGFGCLGLVVLVIIGAIGANAKRAKDDAKADEQITAGTPDVAIGATELVGSFKDNELRADSRFKGKVLEVRGVVESIANDLGDNPYVTLNGGDVLRSVQCVFGKEDKAKVAELNKGDTVTIRGRCKGLFGNVQLDRCAIR